MRYLYLYLYMCLKRYLYLCLPLRSLSLSLLPFLNLFFSTSLSPRLERTQRTQIWLVSTKLAIQILQYNNACHAFTVGQGGAKQVRGFSFLFLYPCPGLRVGQIHSTRKRHDQIGLASPSLLHLCICSGGQRKRSWRKTSWNTLCHNKR